ncbi:MAG: purine-nucleoside phosphorylase [Coriobacteriia bacterium]|nr:purine-nucleoside phosphorylase [Coriobacteriia bacterium]
MPENKTPNPVYAKVERCAAAVREALGDITVAPIAIVLGSGLGSVADRMDVACTVPYAEIDGLPVSTAPGHAGRFLFGSLDGTPVAIMQGRVHYYEGYPMSDVVLPIRLLAQLGVRSVVLTNVAGAVNPDFIPGSLVLITDQITSFAPSPLIGPNIEEFGVRFPDQSQVYDQELRNCLLRAAEETGIPLKQGVYLQPTGPQFETPAEIRAYRLLGADVVGMSTAVEAMAARHRGLRIVGISGITNFGAGMPGQADLSTEEVEEMGKEISKHLDKLLARALKLITAELWSETSSTDSVGAAIPPAGAASPAPHTEAQE